MVHPVTQKRLLVVAGGRWQVPVVRAAKRRGCFVVDTNPFEHSPAFAFADAHVLVDAKDRERHVDIAREYRVDGVLTDQSDVAVPTVAWVAERLGLRGIGFETALRFTNKVRMREFIARHGYPMPAFIRSRDEGDAGAFLAQLGRAVVVKPAASQGSRGVHKAETREQLRDVFAAARAQSVNGEVIVEEFLDGIELTVEGFSLHGVHHTLAISRKRPMPHHRMVAEEIYYAPEHPGMDTVALRQQHDALVQCMGLPFGITHAEYLWVDGVFYLVEIAARGGGNNISSLVVKGVSGVAPDALLVDVVLGEAPASFPRTGSPTPYAAIGFFNFAPGRVRSIRGVEDAGSIPGVAEVSLNVGPGDALAPPADDTARHGYTIAFAPTRSELDRTLAQVRSCVTVTYD